MNEITEKSKNFKEENSQILEKQTSAFSDKVVHECRSEFLEIFKKTKKILEEGVGYYKKVISNEDKGWDHISNLNENIRLLQEKLSDLKNI